MLGVAQHFDGLQRPREIAPIDHSAQARRSQAHRPRERHDQRQGRHDQIFGGLDPDVIAGGPGDDRIQALDGSVDGVACGDGTDVVFADVDDVVNPNCEDVRR
jgi:hypothetical protein